MRSARSSLAGAVMVMALAAGCASASSGGLSSPLPSTTASSSQVAVTSASAKALKRTVRTFVRASLSNNSTKAFALLSRHCQLTIGRDQLATAIGTASATYGRMSPTTITIESLSHTRATVSYTMPARSLDASNLPWVYQHNGWRSNHC